MKTTASKLENHSLSRHIDKSDQVENVESNGLNMESSRHSTPHSRRPASIENDDPLISFIFHCLGKDCNISSLIGF
ncbi:hypothetical protein P8452_01581 [Trifolium repens]|nr:hypothetical protein P8452_01581 [Trifolium repens]